MDTTEEERRLITHREAMEFPQWSPQEWESDKARVSGDGNNHFVSIAIKYSKQDSYSLGDEAKFGQVLAAASGKASMELITTTMSNMKPHDGISLSFETPLSLETKYADDICFKLTVGGKDIVVPCDRDARINKLLYVNKSSNMKSKMRQRSKKSMVTYTIKRIDLSSQDSYTNHLYDALMHQYVQHNKERIAKSRK